MEAPVFLNPNPLAASYDSSVCPISPSVPVEGIHVVSTDQLDFIAVILYQLTQAGHMMADYASCESVWQEIQVLKGCVEMMEIRLPMKRGCRIPALEQPSFRGFDRHSTVSTRVPR